MCFYNFISTHMLVFAFSCAELWKLFLANEFIYQQYHVKTSPCFNRKLYHLFFKMQEKLRIYAQFEIERSSIIFWILHTCNIYIVTTSASGFKHLYIFCNFYPIKQTFWCRKIPCLMQIFNYFGQTVTHYRFCVFTENKGLKLSWNVRSNFGCHIITWIYNRVLPPVKHCLQKKSFTV